MKTSHLLVLATAGLSSYAIAQTTSTTGTFLANENSRTVTLEARLSTVNENPPVNGKNASGRAIVTIRLDRATTVGTSLGANATSGSVQVDVTGTTSENEVITAGHIHRGRSGINGPVVVSFQLPQSTNTVANQSFSVSNQFAVTEPDMVKILEEIVANPGNFYANFHTQSNPGGHIRGQLEGPASSSISRLETRLNTVVNKDLMDIKRLTILLAAQAGVITPQERADMLKELADRATTQ